MPLLRELIDIPDRVAQGDFVLKLTDGVAASGQTLKDYVVTPQLKTNFADALGFIKGAVEGRTSKAAYLHGSFGSGKSHFMAVLHLLLSGDVQARSIPELADLVVAHAPWMDGRQFLLVPYHMIGNTDMESAILGGYAAHIRKLRPDAPVPGFYLAEALFEDARRHRAAMGDDRFFEALNAGSDDGGGWGQLGGRWDAASVDRAMRAPPQDTDRVRLIGDLIGRMFTSYATVASASKEAFVSLDDGLAIMSQHARGLGYDAVILFLDELILWLASRIADLAWISREGPKLSKLVEAQNPNRPVPIISFVARQRDLRDFIGEHAAGADLVAIADSLKHWEARFHPIRLNDGNLPAVAERRLLAPKSAAAKIEIDGAYDQALRVKREVLDTLLTNEGDRAMFRQVYPFSPALVQTLIAVSSALQRHRTALRLMLQLLVDRRDELELGQVVPVGDLYDVIAEGDQPFDEAMRVRFEDAKRLYKTKLVPLLERDHGVSEPDVQAGRADRARATAFRNDARLLKTLILAALVPEVASLKALTAGRLAALNHGTIRSPVPGREHHEVLRKVRNWAGQVGEIKVGEDANPLITLQVTGVDTETIIANARIQDSPGNRRRKVRELLFRALGIADGDELFARRKLVWKGSDREVEVLYENVREIADDRLATRGDGWTVVIDFPFDAAGHGPQDDFRQLQKFSARNPKGANTLVWLPCFLSEKAESELGTLVILDYLLTGERFDGYAQHLAPMDRVQARSLLSNQKTQLEQRLRSCLDVAYGVSEDPQDAIGGQRLDRADQFVSLDRTLALQRPAAANLAEAFEKMVGQALRHQFPAHPDFGTAVVKVGDVRKVYAEVQKALAEPDRRGLITDKAQRLEMTRIAQALKLGEMGATHFVVGDHWRTHFLRKQAEAGHTGPLPVPLLRRWIDEPEAMGLSRTLQNLIILVFAEQTDRAFIQHGGPAKPTLDDLPDTLELREAKLPPEEIWREAVSRAASLLGQPHPELRNAANVARLANDIGSSARDKKKALDELCRRLDERLSALGETVDRAPRRQTARAAAVLVGKLAGTTSDESLIRALAEAEIATSAAAMAQTIAKAAELAAVLGSDQWSLFAALPDLQDGRKTAADIILTNLRDALRSDEHALALKPVVTTEHQRAIQLLTQTTRTHRDDKKDQEHREERRDTETKQEDQRKTPRSRVIETGSETVKGRDQARRVFAAIEEKLGPDRSVVVHWEIVETTEGA